jgi:hypothetical protein
MVKVHCQHRGERLHVAPLPGIDIAVDDLT